MRVRARAVGKLRRLSDVSRRRCGRKGERDGTAEGGKESAWGAATRRRPSCCQLHAAGRGKQVGLSKAFIPFWAEFPESSEEGELVSSAASILEGKPIVATTWL